jgi:hypothetical protein
MKMSKETYNKLESGMNVVINHFGDDEVTELRHTIGYMNDQFISFIWQMYRIVTEHPVVGDRAIKEAVRSEGLNDSHLETALKKILKRWK